MDRHVGRLVGTLFLGVIIMAGLVIEARPSSAEGVRNGVFRIGPRRIEGLIGDKRVVFERNAGGVFSLMGDGEKASPLAQVAARMELVGHQGEKLTIRQEADSNPHFYYLEEGPQRIGLRVVYTLYDQNDTYHGEGLQEVWLYPNGDLFCSVAMRLTDNLAHAAITNAWLEAKMTPTYGRITVGTPSPSVMDGEGMERGREFQFGDSLPGRFAAAEGDGPALALYWLKEEGRASRMIFGRGLSQPPTYYRWPALFDQFVGGGLGWNQHDSSRLEVGKENGQPAVRLWWVKGSRMEVKGWVTPLGIFAISTGKDMDELRPRIAAHQKPLNLAVEGGEFCGYDDLEGCYVVRKIGNPVQVTLPRDSISRRATVKVFSLSGKGAVVVKVDGKERLADLVSDGGIVDDPLAPVQVQPHAPAKECVLSVGLSPDREHVLTVEERPGIQMVYQAAYQSLDQRRNWVVYSDKCAERGSFEFSALDGKARNISAWGRNQEAVTDLQIFWFECHYSPHDYLNQTHDVEILKNGPDEVKFYYRGTNFSDRAQSEFWVTIPWQADCFQMQAKCRLTVLQTWNYSGIEFNDVLPHEGVYPEKWWYEKVMFLDKDGRLGIHHNRDRSKNENLFDEFEGKAFFAMYPTDRGNLLTLVKDLRPAGHAVHTFICGNYIDQHFSLELGKPPIAAGSVFEADYDLALYGDRTTSQEELAEIGRRSLEAGHFVLPSN